MVYSDFVELIFLVFLILSGVELSYDMCKETNDEPPYDLISSSSSFLFICFGSVSTSIESMRVKFES